MRIFTPSFVGGWHGISRFGLECFFHLPTVSYIVMALFPRLFAVLALAIQAALGPVHLTLEVCHGEVQLRTTDGSRCCPTEHYDDGDGVPTQLGTECQDCFDIELVGSNDLPVVQDSNELPAPPTFAAVAVLEFPGKAPSLQRAPLIARGPPDTLTPTGLLPGVFPLRI